MTVLLVHYWCAACNTAASVVAGQSVLFESTHMRPVLLGVDLRDETTREVTHWRLREDERMPALVTEVRSA